MDELEWQISTDMARMLHEARGGLSHRKKQLLKLALARRIQHLLTDQRIREALEVLERHLDGQAGSKAMRAARERAAAAQRETETTQESLYERVSSAMAAAGLSDLETDDILNLRVQVENEPLRSILRNLNRADAAHAATRFAYDVVRGGSSSPVIILPGTYFALRAAAWASGNPIDIYAVEQAEEPHPCGLVRDILCNPFRPVSFDPAWRTANVVALARTVYEERELPSGQFDRARLAVLADALLDAGCDSADILDHCRSEGPHVRGCWVLDLILGKQ